MRNGLAQKFIFSLILLSVVLSSLVLPVSFKVAHAQQVDASQQGRRTLDDVVNSLGDQRCSAAATVIFLKLNCLVLNVIWLVDKFLSSTFLAAATYIFDLSISYSLKDITGSLFVGIGWGIVRDITNLFFIFILLWIALATIFEIPGYGAKDLLRKLIVAALLINFSLAFGGFFINLTNALGKSFLNPLGGGNCVIGTTLSCGISDKLLAFTSIQSATTQPLNATDRQAICDKAFPSKGVQGGVTVDYGTAQAYQNCLKSDTAAQNLAVDDKIEAAIYQALWLIIIIPILSFVFFAAAIFFLSRYLMLSILMVFAPIVFLFMILPDTRGLWSRWWDNLVKWSFFAPAFFFLLFLTVITFNQLAIANVAQGTGVKGFFGIGFDMILLIVLMIINLLVAQQMGIYGAGMVTGWGNRAAGWVQGAARRGAFRGAIRGAEPGARAFTESRVGQFMARTPGLRALTQPAVAIQKEREELDKERANKVLGAVRTAPPEFAAQRLAGESRSVQEAVYKSARPEDIERIMKGLTKETKDAAGNVVVDKSAAEQEIIKIRNRDPRLAERIENSVKDVHLKVVAAKGVGLGAPLLPDQQPTADTTRRYENFQKAFNQYLNDQSEQKLKTIMTPENIKLEHTAKYIIDNFGAREAKALSKTTEQIRAFAETLMKVVEKQKKTEFTTRVRELQEGKSPKSPGEAKFLAFQELAPKVIVNPTLTKWIASAPGVRALYKGVPLRERGYPFMVGGASPPGGEPAPSAPTGGPIT